MTRYQQEMSVPATTRRRQPAPFTPAGSVLALPGGTIAGDVRALEHAGRSRHAHYEVVVTNETPTPIAVFAYDGNARRGPGRMSWDAMLVPAHSAIAVEIAVALPRRGHAPRVVAEVHAEDAQLTLHAAPPPPPRNAGAGPRRAAFAAATLLAGVGLGVLAVALRPPHIVALAAPSRVLAGSAIDVAYAMSNASGGEYYVEEADGLQVRRGPVPPGSGALHIGIPAGPMPGGYDLRLTARGKFGSDEKTVHLVAFVPAPPHVARAPKAPSVSISDLSVANQIVRAGTPIVVTYRTPAQTGTVRLIDEFGTVRAETLLSPTGMSMLAAPLVETDQDLRVVVTAELGSAHDERQALVRVLRAAAPAAGAATVSAPAGVAQDPNVPAIAGVSRDASVPVATDVEQGVRAASDGPIDVDSVQSAGAPIVVRIVHYEPNLHVAVIGKTGEELEGANVGPNDRAVSLSSPKGLGITHASIVATYASGNGEETVVRDLHIRAK